VRDTNFKDSARREAKSFGLRGWGRDTRDRRVEVLVEGEPEEVRQMIRWCYSDRSGAEVHSTSVYQETPSRDLTDFVIR
jgi:acylphosphatase